MAIYTGFHFFTFNCIINNCVRCRYYCLDFLKHYYLCLIFCTVTIKGVRILTGDLLTFQENLFRYSLLHRLDPVLVQKIVSRHLRLPKNENKQREPFTDFSVMNK